MQLVMYHFSKLFKASYCRVMREISYGTIMGGNPVFLTTSVFLDSRFRGNDGHICDTT